MRKITLLLFLLICYSQQTSAQFAESFDTEIPSTWTIINEDGGSYTWTHQTEYPQAGAGHARIRWESAAHEDYLITPQFTVTSGVSDRISFYAGINTTFWTETFDVRISTTGNTAADFTTTIASETATTDVTVGNYAQYTYDLSAYDGQPVYIAIVATDTDRFYLYVDEFVNDTYPTDMLDYYNLQWPASGSIAAGETYEVYAQAYEDGLTNASDMPAEGIEAWIGYSTADTDPSGGDWTWVSATPNPGYDFAQNNDEYFLNLGAVIPSSGTFYYASRWRLNGGSYTYGGISTGAGDGAWDGTDDVSGVLTVSGPANDECANAIELTVNPDYSCGNVTSGTVLGATDSAVVDSTCSGTDDDDVWYSFVATNTSHRVSLLNVAGSVTDMYHAVYDAAPGCGTLGAALVCSDGNTSNPSGLTVGNTYYVQVYTYTATAGQNTTFDICIGTPPPAPDNDECSNATALTVNADYDCGVVTSGTVASATDSGVTGSTCSGTDDDDVWYSFVATHTTHRVSLLNVAGSVTDMYHAVYDAASGCGTLGAALVCSDGNTSNPSGLTVGNTYYVQVYTYTATAGQSTTFDICIGTPPPPPANDLLANAIVLNCGDDVTGTTSGATQDESDAPDESTVEEDTLADNDSPWVWYSYTGMGVEEEITLSTCGTAQTDFDTEIFVYTGTSGNLTLIDDGYDECGTSSENFAAETTFTSDGTTTYYIAVGGYNSDDVGNFHLAVSCVPLSVNEIENLNAFTYFPNPVKNELKLRAQSNIQNISIYNMLGQEVLRSTPNTLESDVDMNGLQTGAYFVKVTINDNTETIRIIKQ